MTTLTPEGIFVARGNDLLEVVSGGDGGIWVKAAGSRLRVTEVYCKQNGNLRQPYPPASHPTLVINDERVTEGNRVTLTVSMSIAWRNQVTVQYTTVNGTARAGTHFNAASGTLTFAVGETSKTITIQTTEDTRDNPNRTFSVRLSNVTQATLGRATATVTIVDDDDPIIVPAIIINDATVNEGDRVTLTVSLSRATTVTTSVQYATVDGTAKGGTHFTAASGTLTYSAGETSKTITIQTTEDTVDNPNRTFSVRLSNPTRATISRSTATVTILDDDDPANNPPVIRGIANSVICRDRLLHRLG